MILAVLSGFVIPRYLDVFVPPERRLDGEKPIAPNMIENVMDAQIMRGAEDGNLSETSDEKADRLKTLQSQGLK